MFQAYNLIEDRNSLDNVALPLLYRGFPRHIRNATAEQALTKVGLGSHVKSVSSVSKSTAQPALLTGTVKLSLLKTSVTVSAGVVDSDSFAVTLAGATVPNGSPIITAPGPAVGTVLPRGSVIAQVAEEPTFAFVGASPMYITINPGDTGQDVLEIQQNLMDMGCQITDRPGVYGSSTQTAFADFCRSSLNKILPVDDSECPSSASPGGFTIPQSEVVFAPDLPATVQNDREVVGLPVSGTALTLAWGQELLQGTLQAGQAGVLQIGNPVTITLSVNSQIELYQGTVTSVGSGGTDTSSPNAGTSFFVKPDQPISAGDLGKNGAVTVVSEPVSHPVLVVPIAAVYAGPGGFARIMIASRKEKYSVYFTPGPSIGGRVEVIKPSRKLVPGDKVILF